MTRDIRDLLHGAAPDPSGPPDLDWIRRRGRTLVATRAAGIASVVVLAVAGVVGLAAQLGADDDPTPPVIEQPTPDPADAQACPPPSFRPTYLPWLEEGERVPPGDAQEPDDPRDVVQAWFADLEEELDSGPYVALSVHHDAQDELRAASVDEVDVRGETGHLVWVGDPGVGEVTIVWREHSGPCGTYRVSLLTAGMDAYLREEPRVDGDDLLANEIRMIAASLADEDDLAMTCAERRAFPAIADDEVWVFFYCDDPYAYPGNLYATVRAVPAGSEPLAVAMAALAAGPTEEERADGFSSTLAEMGEVTILDASVTADGTAAIVDLSGLPAELTWEQRSFLPRGFMAEIAWNVFHTGVEAIELRLDGSCDAFWNLLTGEDCRLYTANQWGHVEE
jgi:hypothetical protein